MRSNQFVAVLLWWRQSLLSMNFAIVLGNSASSELGHGVCVCRVRVCVHTHMHVHTCVHANVHMHTCIYQKEKHSS